MCICWVKDRGIKMFVLFVVKVQINNNNLLLFLGGGTLFSTNSPSTYFIGYRLRVPYRRRVVNVGSWTHCLTKYCVCSSCDFLVIAFKPQVKWKFFKSRGVCSILYNNHVRRVAPSAFVTVAPISQSCVRNVFIPQFSEFGAGATSSAKTARFFFFFLTRMILLRQILW